ncbi:glycosyltransferase family 2 protein [Acidaminococcus fermentans]|uniref:glycosyltransferase family 2 protein n=1 Tax=Acidaminococcus fermentans TaxID=905 RepID=UPI00242B35E9|nr:glycosyltransferase family 2 protein [Acidaminococcus fermentans]
MMYVLTFIVQLVLFLTFLWTCSTVFMGQLTRKKARPVAAGPSRFAILVCAHNEGPVIGKLLQSLEAQDYAADRYQVFVLADHCTDQTAEVAGQYPHVTVLERNSGPRTGKGAVLSWGIPLIQERFRSRFSHIVIFDADNMADRGFLTAINDSFTHGARLVMGNRLPLNPYDNLISQWYSMYWLSVDVFSKPRYNVDMPAIVSGTGFGFDIQLLEPEGWHTRTMVEDLEFSMQQNFKGVFSEYQDKARFYDEQPVTLKVMVSQLRRWMTGNYEIAHAYWREWFQHFRKKPDIRLIDNFIPMLMCVVFGFYFLTNVLWVGYHAVEGRPLFAAKDILWWTMLYVLSLIMGTNAVRGGDLQIKKMLPGILTGGFFCIFLSLIAVYSVFFPQRKWIPIAHIHKEGPEK